MRVPVRTRAGVTRKVWMRPRVTEGEWTCVSTRTVCVRNARRIETRAYMLCVIDCIEMVVESVEVPLVKLAMLACARTSATADLRANVPGEIKFLILFVESWNRTLVLPADNLLMGEACPLVVDLKRSNMMKGCKGKTQKATNQHCFCSCLLNKVVSRVNFLQKHKTSFFHSFLVFGWVVHSVLVCT